MEHAASKKEYAIDTMHIEAVISECHPLISSLQRSQVRRKLKGIIEKRNARTLRSNVAHLG